MPVCCGRVEDRKKVGWLALVIYGGMRNAYVWLGVGEGHLHRLRSETVYLEILDGLVYLYGLFLLNFPCVGRGRAGAYFFFFFFWGACVGLSRLFDLVSMNT